MEALQDAYNLLGVIWSNRDEQKKAESYLLEAQRLYHQYRAPTKAAASVSSPARPAIEAQQGPTSEAAAGSGQSRFGEANGDCEHSVDRGVSGQEQSSKKDSHAESTQGRPEESGNDEQRSASTSNPVLEVPPSSDRQPKPAPETSSSEAKDSAKKEMGGGSTEKSEFLYTMTAFYLAQVYGQSRQQDQMAEFLGITLDRQLRMGHNFEPLDWGQNCAQVRHSEGFREES